MSVASNGEAKPKAGGGASRLAIVVVVVLLSGVVSAFSSINEYANGTGAVVTSADRNSARFEMVFRDFVQARMRAINIAGDVMLQSRVNMEAVAKNTGLAGVQGRPDWS